eukprot:6207634-Pleurochrysis_carterae.AAC.3
MGRARGFSRMQARANGGRAPRLAVARLRHRHPSPFPPPELACLASAVGVALDASATAQVRAHPPVFSPIHSVC